MDVIIPPHPTPPMNTCTCRQPKRSMYFICKFTWTLIHAPPHPTPPHPTSTKHHGRLKAVVELVNWGPHILYPFRGQSFDRHHHWHPSTAALPRISCRWTWLPCGDDWAISGFMSPRKIIVVIIIIIIWLVVSTILKNMKVNGKDYPIYEMGK